jgi:hypothetical protein
MYKGSWGRGVVGGHGPRRYACLCQDSEETFSDPEDFHYSADSLSNQLSISSRAS